jgi:lysozyme
MKMKTSDDGLRVIRHYESLHDGDLTKLGLQPKLCPAGVWTEGYGSVIYAPDGKVLRGAHNKQLAYELSKIHTIEEAEEQLRENVVVREDFLNKTGLRLKQHEFDALVSFVYNVGVGNFNISTLYRRLKAECRDNKLIEAAFAMWNRAGGERKLGLDYRRRTESQLFINSIVRFYN